MNISHVSLDSICYEKCTWEVLTAADDARSFCELRPAEFTFILTLILTYLPRPSHPIFSLYQTDIKTDVQTKTHMQIFVATLFCEQDLKKQTGKNPRVFQRKNRETNHGTSIQRSTQLGNKRRAKYGYTKQCGLPFKCTL